MKKFIFLLTLFLYMFFFQVESEALSISAQYACLIDAQSGQILYEKNAHETHSMASTTKIMTALLALENSQPDEIVTISAGAAKTEGSSIYLKAGETLPMSDLLYGLMLESGNDAAVAIAEHIAGNIETFAQMMTERAHQIGAANTFFQNPNGLDAEGHHTTAYELALITRHALLNDNFAEIVATKRKTTDGTSGSTVRTFYNHNKMLSRYLGCVGVKTGYTKKTGRCLVTAAMREHTQLICVTLNAPDDWNDHSLMLDYGFTIQKSTPLIMQDMVLKSLPVKNGTSQTVELLATEDFYISLNKEEGLSKIKLSYTLPAYVPAPVPQGVKIGKLHISYDGKIIQEMDLVTGVAVDYLEPPQKSFWDLFKQLWSGFET